VSRNTQAFGYCSFSIATTFWAGRMGNMALMSSRDRDTKLNYNAPGTGLQELVHMENRRKLFYFLSHNIP